MRTVVLTSVWNRQGQLQCPSSDTLRILCFFLGFEKGELFRFEELHQLFTPFSKIIWKFIQLRGFYLFWLQFCLVSCSQSSLSPPMRKLYEWAYSLSRLWTVEAPESAECGWVCFLRRVGRNLLVFGEVLFKKHILYLWDFLFNPRGKGELLSQLCPYTRRLSACDFQRSATSSLVWTLLVLNLSQQVSSMQENLRFSPSPISSVFVQCKQFLP